MPSCDTGMLLKLNVVVSKSAKLWWGYLNQELYHVGGALLVKTTL